MKHKIETCQRLNDSQHLVGVTLNVQDYRLARTRHVMFRATTKAQARRKAHIWAKDPARHRS